MKQYAKTAETIGAFSFLLNAFLMFKNEVIKIEDIRCEYCNQLLLKADYVKGEIKCPRCKKINKLEIDKEQSLEPHTNN